MGRKHALDHAQAVHTGHQTKQVNPVKDRTTHEGTAPVSGNSLQVSGNLLVGSRPEEKVLSSRVAEA